MTSRSFEEWLQLPSYVFKMFIWYRSNCAYVDPIVFRECTSFLNLEDVNMVGGIRFRKYEVGLRQIR